MTKSKEFPKVGDVITSKKFAYGYRYDETGDLVYVDGRTKKQPITEYISEEKRVALAAKTGKIPPKTRTYDRGAYDKSRASALFVVEKADLKSGGYGHGIHDAYPDGWCVRARRLKDNGTYNPTGEVIEFYTSGCFNNQLDPKDIKVIKKMKMGFI